MKQQIEKVRSELADALLGLESIDSGLERVTRGLQVIDSAIKDLNEIVSKTPFSSRQEEIIFFKQIKPELLGRRIEEVMRYNLLINEPISTNESKIKYYQDELRARQSYFRMNAFHYQYFKNGLTDLDHL